jgi:hypothetical protein
VFLKFLLDNDVLKKNPLKGIAKASKFDAEDDTGRAFTQAELDAIFEPTAFAEWSAKYPHRFFAPLIGLFTGARITEVCQLYVDDIATEHGVPGFHIRKNKPGQKLKNKSSLRFIPVAKPLLDAGFLTFVDDMKAAGQERLFPHFLDQDKIEERFGLLATLNSLEADALRSIDKRTFDAVDQNSRVQVGLTSAAADFGIDIERDLIKGIVGYALSDAVDMPRDVSAYTIVFGIISQSDEPKLRIPFFARVALKNVYRRLESIGYTNICIAKISVDPMFKVTTKHPAGKGKKTK